MSYENLPRDNLSLSVAASSMDSDVLFIASPESNIMGRFLEPYIKQRIHEDIKMKQFPV